MSDTPRNKVNILAICEAATSDAKAKEREAKKAAKSAGEQLEMIKQKFAQELEAANAELRKTATLIDAVVQEGVDSQILEKKADDIKARIKRIQEEQLSSKALEAAKEADVKAEKAWAEAEDLLQACLAKAAKAELLKESFDRDKNFGAIEAPEYATLDEAIDEYIANIPMVVSISEEMNIDRVALWASPGVSKPSIFKIHPRNGQFFRYDRMPESLAWLKEFPGSVYASMPRGNVAVFQSGGLPFVVREKDEPGVISSGTENGAPVPRWVGELSAYYSDNHFYGRAVVKTPAPSIFAPHGMETFTRAGLCYVKSEAKFYCLGNQNFGGSQLNVSILMEDFQRPMQQKLQAAIAEFDDLLSAKEPLAVRLLGSVQSVGVLKSAFESRSKRLTGGEIAKEVGAYWDAFINAPWEDGVTGDVAMIKHLCERKIETPHVWSHAIKGYYGLRVRTRDHDWILARLYCPPEFLTPNKPISPESVMYVGNYRGACDALIKVGHCHIQVQGRSK